MPVRGLRNGEQGDEYNDVIDGLSRGILVDNYFEKEDVRKILEENDLKWGEHYYTAQGILYVRKGKLGDLKNILSRLKLFNKLFKCGETEDAQDPNFYSIEISKK
ncbi:MAG: hypothetical protein HZA34_03815 [Candidatus Pacebacteria bacterium]|nr:hypothetical protein [Candidatus Paceibacterota bacterium]